MKNKNILIALISFLVLSTNSDAQEPGEWSEPAVHPCYQGIKISVANMGQSKDPAGYRWGIRFFNDKYSLPVSFKYKLSIGEKVTSKEGWLAVGNLKKGDSYSDAHDKFTAWTYASSSEEWYVYIWDVCFHEMRCGGADECFAECDKTAGKENQLCGLSEEYKPTPGSNQPSLLEGTAAAPDEEEPEDKGPADKWEADDKAGELQVIKKEDGLLVKLDGEKEYRFFKKIGDKTYRHESGKEFDIIKFSTDDKFSYWHNGVLENHYTLVTEDDGESKVRSGIWTKGLSYSKVKITVTKDGLTYHSINDPDDGSPFFKRISATEYRRYDPGGVLFCSLTLKEDERLHHICHDKPASYVKVEELVFSSAEEDKNNVDISEWKDKKGETYRIIIAKNDNGLVSMIKGIPRSTFYTKVTENTYETTFKNGTKQLLEFIDDTKYKTLSNYKESPKKVSESFYELVAAKADENKPGSTAQNFPVRDIKGKWNYVGINMWSELQLTTNGEGLYASFTYPGFSIPEPFKNFPFTKVHQYFYTNDTDTTNSWIRYINDTTLSISYQHRNLKTVSYYTRPAAPPIVKQENKPAPVTENKTVTGNSGICGKWSLGAYDDKHERYYGSYIIDITCTGDMLSIRYEKDLSKLYQGTVATGTITTAQKTSGYYYGVSLLKNEPIYLPAWSGICPFKTENEQTNLPGTWIYLQNESGELLTLKVGNIQISFTKAK
jgi:hypothetical protein